METEYAWTLERSRSFEVGLRRPRFMKFENYFGLCGFYQQFVDGFQAVAAPLTAIFKADFEWQWTAVHQASLDKVKQAMINATHLSAINPRKLYHYLKTCPRPLTQRQARWSQFLGEYNLTLWYVPGLQNPAADASSRLTSRQLMDIENATRTRAFVVPLVENWVSPEVEPVDEFLHVLEDLFLHDEVWPQPYNDLYVLLRSGRSVGMEPNVGDDAEPALKFDTEPAVEPDDLKPLPSN